MVVVYTAVGETLLLERLRPVFWQSVTGSLEWHNETSEDAARREVYEETGIESAAGWVDWKISRYFPILPAYQDRFAPGTRVNQEHMFSLQLPEPCSVKLMREEHSDSEWLPLTKGRDRVWSWTNRAALDQVAALRA
uniref:NUDIX hydrolase (NtpA, nudB) n=1 Tax=uncultured marine group II/III euryarchaeote KM3_86_F07 TaxID=1456529 RepID=A0A075HUM8_9EURY|nr:NUDIX hydrolase (ntpA, nudB) [uncultured marine group II/III euryarchaeote KM3_86_F07]